MANRFLNNIKINDSYTLPPADGTANQIIVTDGGGDLSFDDLSAVSGVVKGVQSNIIYYEVKNSTGTTIETFKGVMAVGTDGNSGHILIDEMVADGTTVEARYFLGITQEAIPNGGIGRVIAFGEIDQVNTNAFPDGTILWCDPANPGDFTATEPDGPNLKIPAAFVLNQATNGKIQVRVQGHEGIKDLYDTKITTQVDGDVLVWKNTEGIWQNDSTLNVDYAAGNIGIGTTDPDTKLEINGPNHDANFTSGCLMIQQDNGDRIFIDGNDIDCADGILFLNDYSLNAVRLGGDLQVPNGNVGIGTTNPLTKLHADFGTLTNGDVNELVLQSKANGSTYYSNSAITGITFTNWINGYTAGSLDRAAGIYGYNADTAERFGRFMGLSFYTSSLDAAATEKMRINHLGYVGIGTTDPTAKLEVRQDANNGNTGAFTNPHVKLTASATADNQGFVGITAATSTANNYGYSFGAQRTTGGVGDFKINYHNNSAAGTNRFLIDQNGNVGIGYTDPQEKLHVYNGSVYITPIVYAANQNDWVIRAGAYNNTAFDQGLKLKSTSGGSSYMAFETTGNTETMVLRGGRVGIGTNSPRTKLHISGLTGDDDPSLGASTAPLFVSNTANSYGLNIGVNNLGDAWLQAQSNTSAIAYDILLNPLGGNVGIGTNSPGKLLELKGGDNEAVLRLFNDQANTWDIQNSTLGKLDFIRGSSNTYMRIDQNGNVGIGTDNPLQKLSVAPDTDVSAEIGKAHIGQVGFNDYAGFSHVDQNSQQGYALIQYSDGATYMNANTGKNIRFRIGNSDKMILNSSGNVGIGVTGPTQKLHVNGSALVTSNLYIYSTSYYLNIYFGRIDLNATNGVAVRSGTTYKPVYASAFTVSSDYRLKSNIAPLENAIDRLNQLEVHRFNWNDRLNEPKVDGFIAHEVAPIIPEAVLGEKDAVHEDGTPNHQGIDQSKIVPLLTAALQEAITKIESLEARIQILENQ